MMIIFSLDNSNSTIDPVTGVDHEVTINRNTQPESDTITNTSSDSSDAQISSPVSRPSTPLVPNRSRFLSFSSLDPSHRTNAALTSSFSSENISNTDNADKFRYLDENGQVHYASADDITQVAITDFEPFQVYQQSTPARRHLRARETLKPPDRYQP